jgi:hypothetical protein
LTPPLTISVTGAAPKSITTVLCETLKLPVAVCGDVPPVPPPPHATSVRSATTPNSTANGLVNRFAQEALFMMLSLNSVFLAGHHSDFQDDFSSSNNALADSIQIKAQVCGWRKRFSRIRGFAYPMLLHGSKPDRIKWFRPKKTRDARRAWTIPARGRVGSVPLNRHWN